MKPYAIIEAPSMLGTSPQFGGVRHAPDALLRAGLADSLGARRAGRIEAPPYVEGRDPVTQITNAHGLREYAFLLGAAVTEVLDLGIGRPLVRDDDIAAVGFRDQANQEKYGRSLPSAAFAASREDVRGRGAAAVAAQVVEKLTRAGGPDGYFVHMDADCIDGKLLPAVDDPSPDGFTWDEARELLRPIARHPQALGMQVTIYDPTADKDGEAGRALVEFLASVFR